MTSNLPSQRDAIAAALALYPARPFAVSDIGSQSGWLKAGGHDARNLYVSGPMGLATSVALGLAAVRPNEQVLAIAGDGALAMNLTSLATIAGAKPKNLSILLVDNRVYEFTASVPTPTRELDWLAIGRAFFAGSVPAAVRADAGTLGGRCAACDDRGGRGAGAGQAASARHDARDDQDGVPEGE